MQKFLIILALFLCFQNVQAQNFKFGKVSEEEVLEKAHPVEKDANAAVLYRSVKTYYEYSSSGFTLVTDVHERIKIYNKDGFEWATKEILYYHNGSAKEHISGLKGNTYNIVDGKLKDEKLKKEGIFDSELSKYQLSTKFTMPAVTEGSVIEYEYSLRSPFVTSIDDMLLQYTIPINQIEASVSIPEFFGFKKHANPRSPLFLTINEGSKLFTYTSTSIQRENDNSFTVTHSSSENKVEYNQKIYSLSKSNIPSLKLESYIDDLSNYGAFLKWELQFTKFPNSPLEDLSITWEGVTKSIYTDGGYEAELKKSNYFEKDIDKLVAGITDPIEKADKIYQFVKTKMKWNDYLGMMAESGTSKAYKEGMGNVADINLMLTAMLKYAGLTANPVLVSTKNNGVPLFPTRKGFNYVIAGLEIGEGLILLDATEPFSAFGELPERARNWNGRLVKDEDNSMWVNLMPAVQSQNKMVVNVQFEKDFKLKGKVMNSMNGYYAKSYRDKYLKLDSERYLQILEEGKGNLEISDLVTENDHTIGSEIKQNYQFDLSDGAEIINDQIFFKPLLFLAEQENPFKADKRDYPIIFDYPTIFNKTVNILLPEGYKVESVPESAMAHLNDGAGTFKFITFQNGNFLRIETELELKNIVYTPADYEALKKFYGLMVEKHSEAVVLKRI